MISLLEYSDELDNKLREDSGPMNVPSMFMDKHVLACHQPFSNYHQVGHLSPRAGHELDLQFFD